MGVRMKTSLRTTDIAAVNAECIAIVSHVSYVRVQELAMWTV